MELPAFFFLLSLPPPTLSWMYLEVWELLVSPRDGGTWWPAVYGVAQSRTRLKRLSSGSVLSYISYLFPSCNLYSDSDFI